MIAQNIQFAAIKYLLAGDKFSAKISCHWATAVSDFSIAAAHFWIMMRDEIAMAELVRDATMLEF